MLHARKRLLEIKKRKGRKSADILLCCMINFNFFVLHLSFGCAFHHLNLTALHTEDLEDNIKAKWKKCLSLTCRTTTNENLHLIQFKLMTRIYYIRDKLNKFNKSLSAKLLLALEMRTTSFMPFGTAKTSKTVGKAYRDGYPNINSKLRFQQAYVFFKIENIQYSTNLQILFSSPVF